ncbi:hypothetical protein SK128_017004 [Halocaridina rubra]|uniref:Uncharacterized protein n=1 Tax=Halocaridina rubra TaxID=373956 RepID=A0AAN8ZW84_HALRR
MHYIIKVFTKLSRGERVQEVGKSRGRSCLGDAGQRDFSHLLAMHTGTGGVRDCHDMKQQLNHLRPSGFTAEVS